MSNSRKEFTDELIIEPKKFNFVVQKLRQYCLDIGMIESHTQNRMSILSACEDPYTIATVNYRNFIWPLQQTGQMWLEYDLLHSSDDIPGFFCVTTSYRNEPHPIKGRHDLVFPMFEFELRGNFDKLVNFCEGLLTYLGYDKSKFNYGNYTDVAQSYNTHEIEHTHEHEIYKDKGPAFFLMNFPEYTSPFWNMKRHPDGKTAYKLDVLLSGMETIGSAERSCDVKQMYNDFHTISEGKYAETLYKKLGRENVDAEVNEFLATPTITTMERFGGGIGMTRLIKSMEKEGLLNA